MFSGEAEIQARRRTLAVLQDEVRTVLDGARDLALAYESLLGNDEAGLLAAIAKIRKSEEDVESLRRTLTRELAEIGTMLINREDLLRAAYEIEEIAGFTAGIAFRFRHVSAETLESSGLAEQCRELISASIASVNHLNKVVHALSGNPLNAINMAYEVQRIEHEVDKKYRDSIVKLFKQVDSFKDLIVLKDIIEGIEDLADRCLAASDSMTIVALGL